MTLWEDDGERVGAVPVEPTQVLSPGMAALGGALCFTMATHRIRVALDENLVLRVREQDVTTAGKSDGEVIEDVIAVYLGDRALQEAQAQGTLDSDEADRLALEEVHAVRRARRDAA